MVITSNAVHPASPAAISSMGFGPVPPAVSSNRKQCSLPVRATNCLCWISGCVNSTFAEIIISLPDSQRSHTNKCRHAESVTGKRSVLGQKLETKRLVDLEALRPQTNAEARLWRKNAGATAIATDSRPALDQEIADRAPS